MKKVYLLFFLVPFMLMSQLHGQGYLEVFGLRTWATPQPQFYNKGWGGGMNFLGPKKAVVGKDNLHPLDMQFGMGFYVSGFGVKKFKGVPLLPPLTGNAKVNLQNTHVGFYGMLRFSSTNKNSGRMPYLDLIGGYRYVGSSLNVIPDKVPAGYSSQTDSTMYRVSSLMYGVGAGMQIKLSDHANLDFELTWTYAPNTGNIVDLKSGQKNADGISFDTQRSPNSIMLLKVGFNFLCEDSGNYSRSNNCGCHSGSHSSYHSTYHSSGGGGHSSVHVSSGGGGHVMAK